MTLSGSFEISIIALWHETGTNGDVADTDLSKSMVNEVR